MTDLQKFQRVCRVFLARLLTVHGEIAPDEDYRQQCLGHMTEFWNIKIHDRGPE